MQGPRGGCVARRPEYGRQPGLGRERRGLIRTVRLSDRDGSGGALDRYEPINLQIGHPDLVSVLDSLKELGARKARVWHVWMRTECLAFGVPIPIQLGTTDRRLAMAVAGQ